MEDFSFLLAAGLAAAFMAALAWFADHRRTRRRNLDAVGCMPWTGLFFWLLLAACVLLGLAARQALAG